MKIWITKNNPYEFVHRGMDSLTVWFLNRPVFDSGGTECQIFGVHGIQHPQWTGRHSVSGKVLRKLTDNAVAQDVWDALRFSYRFDDKSDLYSQVNEYYDVACSWYRQRRPGREKLPEDMDSELYEKMFYRQWWDSEIYGSNIVEKEGQRWWEWCLEYDVDLVLSC